MSNLSGRIALVTGASRGIGRAGAIALAKAGAHVILTARTVGGLEETDDEIQKRLERGCFAELWRKGEYFPLLYSRQAVQAATVQRISLQPAP